MSCVLLELQKVNGGDEEVGLNVGDYMWVIVAVLDGVWNWGVLIVWFLGRLLEILLLSAEKEVIEYDRENKRTSNDFTWLMFDRYGGTL